MALGWFIVTRLNGRGKRLRFNARRRPAKLTSEGEKLMNDSDTDAEGSRAGAGDAGITGGTDKTGEGALASGDMPDKGGTTGVEETGDLTGATSTHAGAGGVFDNTGGTGTAPT